jgi:hypothetical protein
LGATVVFVLSGCGRSPTTDPKADAGAVTTTAAQLAPADGDAGFVSAASELAAPAVDAGGARSTTAPSPAGQKVDVPAGTFASGSTPGDEGREAAHEPALAPVKLGAFAIDALPYPNDPTQAPEMVASAAEAERACNERGARLCTELEWERACKGPENDRYATGETWNVACDQAPSRCASGFGARAMGFMREWTDGPWRSPTGESRATFGASGREEPVVRGGPGTAHRCAARSRATAKGMPGQMAFRCCHGDRNDVAVAPVEPRPSFRRTEIDAAELTKIFGQIPELARISEGVRLFDPADVKSIIARAGSKNGEEATSRAEGISFATSPILWSPEPGVELLVASGRAKKTGFVVALWTLPNGKYRFASSFLFLNDIAPVALAWEPSHRRDLRWTTCWSCAGEQGAVSLRDDGRAVIVQY